MQFSRHPQEIEEDNQHKAMAKSLLSLRDALNTDNPQVIAKALHDHELPRRTERRFEYAIEWKMLGTDKVSFWEEVKSQYSILV